MLIILLSSVLSGLVWLTGAALAGVLFHRYLGAGHYFGVGFLETEASRAVLVFGAFWTSSLLAALKARRAAVGRTDDDILYGALVGFVVSLPVYIAILLYQGKYYAQGYMRIVLLDSWPMLDYLWEETLEIAVVLLVLSAISAAFASRRGDETIDGQPAVRDGKLSAVSGIAVKASVVALLVLAIYGVIEVPRKAVRAREIAEQALRDKAGYALDEIRAVIVEASSDDHMEQLAKKVEGLASQGVEVVSFMVVANDGTIRWSLNPADVGKKERDRGVVSMHSVPEEPEKKGGVLERHRLHGIRVLQKTEKCHGCHGAGRNMGYLSYLLYASP